MHYIVFMSMYVMFLTNFTKSFILFELAFHCSAFAVSYLQVRQLTDCVVVTSNVTTDSRML